MKIYTNELTQKIYDILLPLVGEVMAKSSLKLNSNAIGITEETIKKSDLPAISERIRKGVVIFIGSEMAGKVATKISQLN